MLDALEHAKRRGARIVAINPLPEAGLIRFRNPQTPRGARRPGTALADRYLPVRVNGDLALFAALNKTLVDATSATEAVLDHDFIDQHCDGFEERDRRLARAGLGRPRGRKRPLARTGRTTSPSDVVAIAQRDRLLGDGTDPAPQRRGRPSARS